MTQEVILWLLTQAAALVSVGVIAHINVRGAISSTNERVAKIEGFMESIGHDFAKVLHCPNDKFGLDALLDVYMARDCEMSPEQWTELRERCRSLLSMGELTDLEKIGCMWLKRLAEHKMARFLPERSTKPA